MALHDWVSVVMGVSLLAYALLGGADFGGGIWDLLAFGPRRRAQREAIAHAIGPVWEANHVWLIVVIVMLFSGFAGGFAVIMTALSIPITLALFGIVLRGSTFMFRRYDAQDDAVHRRWSTVFGISSLLTPLFLGATLGALATGEIRVEDGRVLTGFAAGWLTPFAVGVGLFAQGLFAYLAAVYMAVETAGDADQPALFGDFRARGLFAGLMLVPAAGLVLLLARSGAPVIFRGLTTGAGIGVMVATGVALLASLVGLWTRRMQLSRGAAVLTVAGIMVGWWRGQNPYLVVPDVSFADVAAPAAVLRMLLLVLGIGSVILVPSFLYLFRIFKSD